MIVVVVQPDNHGRVFGQFYQQGSEAAQAVPPEHIYLVKRSVGLVELDIASGEETVPEEGQLLFQGASGSNHPVQPVGPRTIQQAHLGLLRVVAPDDVIGHVLRVGGVKQLLDHRFIALGDVFLKLIPGRAKSRSAHEMRHQLHLLVTHVRLLWTPSFLSLPLVPTLSRTLDEVSEGES